MPRRAEGRTSDEVTTSPADPVPTNPGAASVPGPPTTVAIVEDHPLYRQALERLVNRTPGITLLTAASSIEEFAARTRQHTPDVAVLDLNLPGVDGVQGITRVASQGVLTLVLSASIDGRTMIDAIGAGARGYVSKDAQVTEIVAAIRAVVAGETYLSPTLAPALLRTRRRDEAEAQVRLSEREREILQHVTRGETDQQIAVWLGVSVSTVRTYLDRIRNKTGLRRRVDLARYALEHDLGGTTTG
ncbi:MAG: response regulator [Phycicoccus sp.]